MPTYCDETLHDRYAREHADHMARLAKMTPEQIAEMELSLHNAMAEVDRLRAKASQEGEAVEVVGWACHFQIEVLRHVPLTGGMKVSGRERERYHIPLMTVAQHKRMMLALVARCYQEGAFKTCLECGYQDGHDQICQYHESKRAAASDDLTNVRCLCCQSEHAHNSYDAGFIAGSGMCQACDAAMPAKDLPAVSAEPVEWQHQAPDGSWWVIAKSRVDEARLAGRPIRPLYTHPADQVADYLNMVKVSRELLQDLRDLAFDAVEHHRQAFAGYKQTRQASMDSVIRDADALLANSEGVKQ